MEHLFSELDKELSIMKTERAKRTRKHTINAD